MELDTRKNLMNWGSDQRDRSSRQDRLRRGLPIGRSLASNNGRPQTSPGMNQGAMSPKPPQSPSTPSEKNLNPARGGKHDANKLAREKCYLLKADNDVIVNDLG